MQKFPKREIFMQITNIKELGKLIKEKRKEQGLTQKDLALTAGIGVRLIVELERGMRGVNIETILKICMMLGLKVEIE